MEGGGKRVHQPLSLSGRQDGFRRREKGESSLVNGHTRPPIPENLLPTASSYVVTLLSIAGTTHIFLFTDDGVIRQAVCDWHQPAY